MFRKAGIPAVGFTTMGNPSETYTEWMELLEDVFNEDGHMADKIALGKDLVAGARARTAKVPEDQRVSTMVLMGAADGQLAVAGGKDGWFTNEWADSLNYTNVSRDTDTSHTPVTFEQVLTWDPQVLLVTGKGMSNMTANSVLTNSVEGVDFSTPQLRKVRPRLLHRPGHVELVHPQPGCSHRRQLARRLPVPGSVL